jgi:hypothetical protein
MKLIVEKIGEHVFVYRESKKHFKKIEPTRTTPLIDAERFDSDCDVANYGNFHAVFDIEG